jgi:pectin methylesterase-like acyl-CoA thioesterase
MPEIITEGTRRIVVALVAGLVLASCSSEKPDNRAVAEYVVSGSNVTARWKPCPDSAGIPTDKTVVDGVSWENGKMIINVRDNEYCGGTEITEPSYTLSGDDLELRWAWRTHVLKNLSPGVPPLSPTACACDQKVRFELANLTERAYNVKLARARRAR